MSISCEQFETLMNFYLDNKLDEKLQQEFEKHLLKCKSCRDKYNTFKNIVTDLRETYKKIKNYSYANDSKSNSSINTTISAYLDNELDINENVKVRKMFISKPDIREKIKKISQLKLLLNSSFNKTQPKQDYSKELLKKIYSTAYREKNTSLILRTLTFIILSCIWVIMLLAAISA